MSLVRHMRSMCERTGSASMYGRLPPFGHYEPKVLSVELINAPATYQAVINDIFIV